MGFYLDLTQIGAPVGPELPGQGLRNLQYSPGASVSFSKIPEERFTFTVSFGCGPQNVEKLIASTLDEIEKLKTDGPLQVNVDKYKAETLHAMETSVKTNNFWSSYINAQLQNKEDLTQIDSYTKVITC